MSIFHHATNIKRTMNFGKVGDSPPDRYVIADVAGEFETDKEYTDGGVNEGWLEPNGWYRERGGIVYRYRHLGK